MERRSFVASLLGLAILPRFANRLLPTSRTIIFPAMTVPVGTNFITLGPELIRVTAYGTFGGQPRITAERGYERGR